jgi:hypothetical protein
MARGKTEALDGELGQHGSQNHHHEQLDHSESGSGPSHGSPPKENPSDCSSGEFHTKGFLNEYGGFSRIGPEKA